MNVIGILETALYVTDPTITANFYRNLFGFETLLESERLVALNVAGRSVLLLFKQGATNEPFTLPNGDVIPPHSGTGANHFAFAIAAEDVDAWQKELSAKSVRVESVVTWPGGAKSIYFRDPDHNLAELITPRFWALGGGP